MPSVTMIQRRNKGMISLNAACGLIISELRTVKMKNLIREDGGWFIYANPKDMKVKNSMPRRSPFVQAPQDIIHNIINWKSELIKIGFGGKDPIFPKIMSSFNQLNFLESAITKEEIKSGSQIRDIFKKAFNDAGYEYINPHNFRHTRARFASKQSPEYLNATRQVLGQKNIDTTPGSYGELSLYE